MEQLNRSNEEEISLYDLWKVIIKRKKLVIGLFLVAVISAMIIIISLPRIYRGDAVLVMQPASNITEKEMIEFIGKIDYGKETKALPKSFALITEIKFDVLKDSKDKIAVTLESKDINAIRPALSEIVEYLNDIDYVKRNVKEEQEKLLTRSKELAIVIAASGDMVKSYKELLAAGKLMPLGFNPVELNKKISDIKIEKFAVDQNIQRLNGWVEIARQISVGDRPVKPRKKIIIAFSAISGLFLGILFAFIVEYIENITNVNKT